MLCIAADLVVDLLAGPVAVAIDTIEQGNPHRDCSDVEVFVGDHPNRFLDLFDFHGALLKLVHGLIEPFVADVNLHAKLGA